LTFANRVGHDFLAAARGGAAVPGEATIGGFMRPSALFVTVVLAAASSTVVTTPGAAAAAIAAVAPPAAPKLISNGSPDLNAGIDPSRFGTDEAYMESLSTITETLSAVAAKIRTAIGDDPDLVDVGNMTAENTLVVYWSGASDAPALTTIRQIAAQAGVSVIVSARITTRTQLDAATSRLQAMAAIYQARGYPLVSFGGFSPDFDGVKVTVDAGRSTTVPDTAAIQAALHSDTGLPVRVTVGAAKPYDGVNRLGDAPPYSAGGGMLGADVSGMCSSGFGVVYGSSVHRYISARHCEDTPYGDFAGNPGVYGSISKYGAANSGAAVFSAVGANTVFDGLNNAAGISPGTTRRVTQRDPALSTVGTSVCQEGANSGQRCGTITQVAVLQFDGIGFIKQNLVTSPTGAKIASEGDSGAPVISLHTSQRAWAVGILIGGIAPYTPGPQCPNQWWDVDCTANFTFNNIDYAIGGLPGYAMYYAS
jgi:hypothetical protein